MSWVVAIPSYNRPVEIAKKTLHTLSEGGVPASKIFVFVVADQLAEYKSTVDPSLYGHIIVGKKGLVNQRQFISDYFPKDKLIFSMDDDIKSIKKKVSDTKLATVKDLPAFISKGFAEMKKYHANLWGIPGYANTRFLRGGVSNSLKYIIGAVYGYKNLKDPALRLKFGDNQEDKERTMRFWLRDKSVVRLNDYAPYTQYYAPGGMENAQRKKDTKEFTAKLVEEFPGYLKQIQKPQYGIYDLMFLRKKADDEMKGEGFVRRVIEGEEDTSRTTLPIRNRKVFTETRDKLLEVLRDTTIPPLGSARKSIKQDVSRADIIGSIGRTITLGFGDTRHGVKEYATNKRHPELLRRLAAFGNAVVPVGWDYNAITLNEGVKARKHKDRKNLGPSVIIGIGDFTGGAIRVWDEDDANPKDYNLHDHPVMFNGGRLFHQTQPFKGERYTMIFYKQLWEGNVKGVLMEGRGELDEDEESDCEGGIFA